MFAPGGFDARLEQWTTLGVHARTKLLELLDEGIRDHSFDRRECGASGGRVERVTWSRFAAQAKWLLDHLNIERAHLVSDRIECHPAMGLRVGHPYATLSLVLYWPGGGACHRPPAFCGTPDVRGTARPGASRPTGLSRSIGAPGPWGSPIRRDRIFADSFARQNLEDYNLIVVGMARTRFDRDTAPGASPNTCYASTSGR